MVRLALFLVLTLVSANSAAQTPLRNDKPNVVLIIMDDVGYGDYGGYGATDIRTPNIDSLARDGVRFTDFYAAPTCSPTRAALISGRYQQRVRIDEPIRNPGTPGSDVGLPPPAARCRSCSRTTATRLAWSASGTSATRLSFEPNAHGFDDFFGFLSGGIDYYQHTGLNGKPDLYENDTPVQVDGYMTDLITERSVRFIEAHAQQPFFLEVAYNAAHWPFQVPDKPSTAVDNARFLQPTDEPTATRQEYVAMLERADRGVGEILATLRKRGLERDTLVIFTNDNGGEWLSRNAPLFHRKESLWEGGIRVPLLVRWPGTDSCRKQVSRQVGIVMDLTATILAATGTAGSGGRATRWHRPPADPARAIADG